MELKTASVAAFNGGKRFGGLDSVLKMALDITTSALKSPSLNLLVL